MLSARLLTLSISCLAVVGAAEKFSFERLLMGTKFGVVCYAESRVVAEKAAEKAFSKAEEINAVASDYLPDSELSLLSSKPVGIPVPLSPLLFDLLDHSRRITEATDGAFDPTLGPMTKLWRETRSNGCLPDAETLAAARTASGWRHFTLDPEARTITLLRENMAFDLGGIAKGYAADLMLDSLAVAGIHQALVTAGGDIRLGDAPPGREGWKVAVKTFEITKNEDILTLSNAAVSTSGDLHQSVKIEGVNYSHILDPATGYLYMLGKAHEPGRNQIHRLYVHGADSTNSRTVTHANLTGRKSILEEVRKMKGRLMHLQPETGFRETYRIEGETLITVNDYRDGRIFEDAICYAFYPVDLHTKEGVKPEPLKPGKIPTVPLRALIPKGSRDIIVAGRCVSSDRLANSGLRVQASCMGMGQAAGAAATLAAKAGTTPLEVPLKKLHALLREHGAIIPGDV